MLLIFIIGLLFFLALIRLTRFSLLNALLKRLCGRQVRVESLGWKSIHGIDIYLRNGIQLRVSTLRVKFFPTHFSKPLLLSFHDVRFEFSNEVLESASSDRTEGLREGSWMSKFSSLMQYVAVSVDSAYVIWLDANVACMFHLTFGDVRVEAFKNPRCWQLECSCGLVQGKMLNRVSEGSGGGALGEVSLSFSLSVHSTLEHLQLAIHNPYVSLSSKGVEKLCSVEGSRWRDGKATSSPVLLPPSSSSIAFSHLQITLTAFTFTYTAAMNSMNRRLSLSTGAMSACKRSNLFQVQVLNVVVMSESEECCSLRSSAILASADLNESGREMKVSTDGISATLSLTHLLLWSSHFSHLSASLHLSEWKKRRAPSSSPSSSPFLPYSLAISVSQLDCAIVAVNGKKWLLSAKLFTVSRAAKHGAFEMGVAELCVRKSGAEGERHAVHQWGELLYIATLILQVETTSERRRVVRVGADECKFEWMENTVKEVEEFFKDWKHTRRKEEKMRGAERREYTVMVSVHKVDGVGCVRDVTLLVVCLQGMVVHANEEEVRVRVEGMRMLSSSSTRTLHMEEVRRVGKLHVPPWTDDLQQRSWKQSEKEVEQRAWRKKHMESRRYVLNGMSEGGEVCVSFRHSSIHCQFSSPLFLSWSPLIHSALLHLLRTSKQALRSLRGEESPPSSATPFSLSIAATHTVQVDMELPHFHYMRWQAPVLQVEVSSAREVSVIGPALEITCDSLHVLSATDVCITRKLTAHDMNALRAASAHLHTKSNKVWTWNAESLHFFLPFHFNFAAVFDEFITCVKWIKLMSGKKSERPLEPQLAADLCVRIQEVVVKMEEDPIEARMQMTHLIREDEVFECERRRQCLADALSALKKSQGRFAQAKVDEFWRKLVEQNSTIYIERVRKHTHTHFTAFSSKWSNFELIALADESVRKDDDCIQFMTRVDPEASLPAGMEFSTLWGRMLHLSVDECVCKLKDYPLPYFVGRKVNVFGMVVGAERLSQGTRSLRERPVALPPPWPTLIVKRNISPLKMFFDLQAETDELVANYGPSWEPALSMCALLWNNISAPWRDPSPLLPFWDKMRFLLHGRVLWWSRKVEMGMIASLDPYNSSEVLRWHWTDWGFEWFQGSIRVGACVDVVLHTCSRYDATRILHVPRVNVHVKMKWKTTGGMREHHAVEVCTPQKLPHSSSQHDSFSAFRSMSLNVELDVSVRSGAQGDNPSILLYANCIRCLDTLFKTISRMSGNTRRGSAFAVSHLNKKHLSKHLRQLHVNVKVPSFSIEYLMSLSSSQGLRLSCNSFQMMATLVQNVIPSLDEKLSRRPSYKWKVEHMCTSFDYTKVCVLGVDATSVHEDSALLSFTRLLLTVDKATVVEVGEKRVTVEGVRMWWTACKRDVCLALAEAARRARLLSSVLQQHLSFILHSAEKERQKYEGRKEKRKVERDEEEGAEVPEEKTDLLQKLIEEADTKKVAHCEQSSDIGQERVLHGVTHATSHDVTAVGWEIELVNSQLMLQSGRGKFIIVSASRTCLSQRMHRSVWRNGQLLAKRSWSALLSGMQYFAPISRKGWEEEEEQPWLPRELIEDKSFTASGRSEGGEEGKEDRVRVLMGEGEAVGGVVDTHLSHKAAQLQRIISRCSCQVYWVSFMEDVEQVEEKQREVRAVGEDGLHTACEEDDEMREEDAVDCITLKHNMLEACTNAEQYSMAVDIVNQLLLFVDPRKKEQTEERSRRGFECRQQSMEDMMNSIEKEKRVLRETMCVVRSLERQLYLEGHEGDRRAELEKEVSECKRRETLTADQLAITISVLRQRVVQASQSGEACRMEEVPLVRTFEVCFEDCTWKLTERDGQLGIAQLHITHFLYWRSMRVDSGGEHLFQLGTIRVSNLLPDSPFPDTLYTDSRYTSRMREAAIRVVCRDLAPVGGIPIKEHVEVNIAPIVVQFTFRFFDAMMTFFFPERNRNVKEATLDVEEAEKQQRRMSLTRRITGGLAMVRASTSRPQQESTSVVDEIERMRLRAHSNHQFMYIKIPEVPIVVSYKGNKEKNIEDLRNISLVFPLCEYHDKNWTWLDLSIAVKQRCRRVLLQQVMKQKLLRSRARDDTHTPSDEDKKRIAIGDTSSLLNKSKK